MKLDQSWCPSCREWTVIDAGRPCAWCGETLVRKRGGYKRPDIQGRITERMAHAIHAKYEAGWSARKLGRELWQVLGYGSARTCEAAIGRAFMRYGLPRRERIEATVLASTSSGLSPRDEKERRRRRVAAGYTTQLKVRQPTCKSVKSQYPRKGAPCKRPASEGSDYCPSHDPALAERREAHMEAMRERSPFCNAELREAA